MRLDITPCLFQSVVEKTEQAGMSAGSILEQCLKGRSYEFGRFVFYFKRVGFAPCLFGSVIADRAETPVPCTAFECPVRIVHAPLPGSGYSGFRIRKVFRLRKGKLKFVSGLHGLGHDERRGIDVEFIVRFRIGLFPCLVV